MIRLMIYVIEVDRSTGNLIPYNKQIIGSSLSTANDIKVNKVNNVYSIVLDEITFNSLDYETFMNLVAATFLSHLPNEQLTMMIQYLFASRNGEVGREHKSTVKCLKHFNRFLIEIVRSGIYPNIIAYIDIKGDLHTVDRFSREDLSSFDNDEDDEYIDDYDEDEDDYDLNEDGNLSYGYGFDDVEINQKYNKPNKRQYISLDDEDDDYNDYDYDDDDYYFHNAKSSKIFKSPKKVKKSFNKYNMIVVKNKKVLKKEYKRMNKILKSFIDSKKLKKIRNEIAKRCVNSYAITNRDAYKIKKKIVKKINKINKRDDDNDSDVFNTIIGSSLRVLIPSIK